MRIDVKNVSNDQVIDVYETKEVNVIPTESDPTVPAWAKQPAKPTYTAAEIGAAPAGYGRGNLIKAYCLSESDVWIDKINSILKNLPYGLTYRINFQDYWTVPTQICNGILWKSGESDALVRGTAYNGITIQRSMKNGIWQPWEYENPPMLLGVEYRTTERYLGKPVYVVAMDLGVLPTSDDKDVYYPVSLKCENIVSYDVIISNPDRGTRTLPTFASDGSVMAYAWSLTAAIRITVLRDMSVYNGRAVIKYVKD